MIMLQGTYAIPRSQGEGGKPGESHNITSPGPSKKTKETSANTANDEPLDDDEEAMDWWTKYFASVDTMIEVRYRPADPNVHLFRE